MEFYQVEKLKQSLEQFLKEYNGEEKINLDLFGIDLKEILTQDQLFQIFGGGYELKKVFSIPFDLVKKINLENFSFDRMFIEGLDFSNSQGVKIDPQTVHGKDLKNCTFKDVTFIGKFDGCDISGANFTGSKEANIALGKIKNLEHANLTDANVGTTEFELNQNSIVKAFKKTRTNK